MLILLLTLGKLNALISLTMLLWEEKFVMQDLDSFLPALIHVGVELLEHLELMNPHHFWIQIGEWIGRGTSSILTLWRGPFANLSSPKCTGIFEWSPSHLGPNSKQSNCHERVIEWDGASPKIISSSSMENGVQVEPLLCSIRILN